MNATERHFQLKRAALRSLADCGGYPVREESIHEQTSLKADFLQPSTAELDAVMRELDAERLSVALPTESGRKLKLTDAGRLWLAEHAR